MSADVTRLQALVDKKKVLISEAVIRDVLRLDEVEGVDYLPNEEIFTGLARRKFNFSKYIFDSLVRNVDSSSKFYMYPRVRKGFSGVETPLFEGMLVVGEIEEHGDEEEQDNVDAAAQGADTAISGDDHIIASLHQEFSMKDLGSLNYFLGIFITRDSLRMFLSQCKYDAEILERAHMVNCNPSRTSNDTESKLKDDGDLIFDPTLYQSLTVL
nr:ribonuclease H-like domain-containing protein [Tanacetum cinerariifolium]